MLKKGIPVSPGVAVARAYCMDGILARREPTQLDVASLPGEIRRFEEAIAAAAADLDAIVERVANQVGEEEAAIFRSHRLLLRDAALVGKVLLVNHLNLPKNAPSKAGFPRIPITPEAPTTDQERSCRL